MTVRGVRLLAEADVVVYDHAAEPALRWARPDAERIAAGAPAERDVAQDAISMLIAEKARDGHTVARLKWGDPFVFDSGAKEAMFLHEQGIGFEVVPGVPAAIGGVGVCRHPAHPSRRRRCARAHSRARRRVRTRLPNVDWRALAALDGTLVCYAAPRLASGILRALVDEGRPPDDAAALIYRGTRPAQRTVTGTIAELLELRRTPETAPRRLLVVWRRHRPARARALVRSSARSSAADRRDAIARSRARTRGRAREPRRGSHRRADVPA